MSTQQLDKGGLVSTVGGIVTEMIRTHAIKDSYDVANAIDRVSEALIKAAGKLDPPAPSEPPKPETEF